jgi:hypothetical protein
MAGQFRSSGPADTGRRRGAHAPAGELVGAPALARRARDSMVRGPRNSFSGPGAVRLDNSPACPQSIRSDPRENNNQVASARWKFIQAVQFTHYGWPSVRVATA